MRDTMTPIERKRALELNKPVDRLPIVLFDNIFSCRLINQPYGVSESSADLIAKKLIASYRRFGHDAVSVVYGIHGLGQALGSTVINEENGPPSIKSYALQDLDELDSLPWEEGEFENDKLQQMLHDACLKLSNEIGHEVETRFHICCPFTATAGIIEPEYLLRQTRKNPASIHQLLKTTTSSLKKIIDQFSKIDSLFFSMSDPVASGSLVSPKVYKEFCLPYTQEIAQYIKEKNKEVSMHICGNTRKIWEYINLIPIDSFSVDQIVDLAEAKSVIGDHCTLLGNVPPVEMFLQGTPSQITEVVKTSYEKAIDSPKGFQLAPGCDVPLDTPFENIDAYMAAGRKYGQWTCETK